MSLRSRSIVRIALTSILLLSISMLAFADTIRLKDGSIIKGRIVGFSGGKFTISIGEGSRQKQLTFMANEVDSILFDTPDKAQNAAADRPADGGKIVNASSTSESPRVIVTDNTSGRTNGTATISANSPGPRNVGNGARPASPDKVGNKADPIAWNVKVLADNTANGWTNSGWVVKKGQRIHISGDGQISLGKGKTSTPSGLGDLPDEMKLLKNVPTGALLAVIGDDNNDFIYIGAEREFTATRDGALFLGINEGTLEDNSGSFNVKVEILATDGD